MIKEKRNIAKKEFYASLAYSLEDLMSSRKEGILTRIYEFFLYVAYFPKVSNLFLRRFISKHITQCDEIIERAILLSNCEREEFWIQFHKKLSQKGVKIPKIIHRFIYRDLCIISNRFYTCHKEGDKPYKVSKKDF